MCFCQHHRLQISRFSFYRLSVSAWRVPYKLKPDAIYILSAKHHLLELDSVIEPYDVTLNKMKKNDRLNWGRKVIELLEWKVDLESDRFIILAGNNYILPIKDSLIHIEQPFYKMRLGERLSFLNKKLEDYKEE